MNHTLMNNGESLLQQIDELNAAMDKHHELEMYRTKIEHVQTTHKDLSEKMTMYQTMYHQELTKKHAESIYILILETIAKHPMLQESWSDFFMQMKLAEPNIEEQFAKLNTP